MKPDIPVLVNHIALRVPVLIHTIAKDLDELLQDGCLAAIAFLRELCRIVVMTVHVALMLVV